MDHPSKRQLEHDVEFKKGKAAASVNITKTAAENVEKINDLDKIKEFKGKNEFLKNQNAPSKNASTRSSMFGNSSLKNSKTKNVTPKIVAPKKPYKPSPPPYIAPPPETL